MGQWEIRRASLADREAIANLCRAAEGPEDYVLEFLDDMILRGVFLVALDGNRIIGAVSYREALDRSAWLAAARTHPEYRRQRVASELIESLAGLARRSGIHALRLWSSASNSGGVASARACGFKEVSRFARMTCPSMRGGLRPPSISFSTELSERIRDSDLLRRGKGYIPYDWYFVKLTTGNVHLMANAGALFAIDSGIACFSAPGELTLEFGLIEGSPVPLLRGIARTAGAMGCKQATGFLPQDSALISGARKLGYVPGTWGKHAILFERPIPVSPTSYRKRRTFAEIAAGKRGGFPAPANLAGHESHAGPHEDRWNA